MRLVTNCYILFLLSLTTLPERFTTSQYRSNASGRKLKAKADTNDRSIDQKSGTLNRENKINFAHLFTNFGQVVLDSRLNRLRVRVQAVLLSGNNLGQVVHTHASLCHKAVNLLPLN